MGIVVPAILPSSFEDLRDKLSRLKSVPAVETVQIDTVDGRFATPATWPYGSGAHAFAEMVSSGGMLPEFERFR